mmetsp:Transcript_9049/g.14831  ORF Transcript_9049/g.14831 Transcript_9049/m.14831 type:complete len:227 (-) Transcript_9049:5057-5737(-)
MGRHFLWVLVLTSKSGPWPSSLSTTAACSYAIGKGRECAVRTMCGVKEMIVLRWKGEGAAFTAIRSSHRRCPEDLPLFIADVMMVMMPFLPETVFNGIGALISPLSPDDKRTMGPDLLLLLLALEGFGGGEVAFVMFVVHCGGGENMRRRCDSAGNCRAGTLSRGCSGHREQCIRRPRSVELMIQNEQYRTIRHGLVADASHPSISTLMTSFRPHMSSSSTEDDLS